MQRKMVVFTEPGKVELQYRETPPVTGDQVLFKTEYTVVSGDCAPDIYKQLMEDKSFPLGTVFDWRDLK